MEQSDLLCHVVGVLERLNLRYLITGSVASIFYGEPRFTNDIDVVVEFPPAGIDSFCKCFPSEDYYLSEEAVRQAVDSRGQFNIIHPASGLKVDVMIAGDSPFDRSRFSRANRVAVAAENEATFAAIEDVIIKKLQAFQEGGSEKHIRDILGMLKISGHHVDRAYITQWAARLGVTDIWNSVEQLESRSTT